MNMLGLGLGFGTSLDQEDDDPVMVAAREAQRQAERAGQSRGEVYTLEDAAEQEAKDQARRAQQPQYDFSRSGRFSLDTRTDAERKQQAANKPTQPASSTTTKPKARDGQSLDGQDQWTQQAFRAQYGQAADLEWVRQHEGELDKNRRLYGTDDPLPGTKPLPTAPAGTPDAPDRKIGAKPPPNPVATQVQQGQAATPVAPATTPTVASAAKPEGDAPTTFGARTDPTMTAAIAASVAAAPVATPTPPPGVQWDLSQKRPDLDALDMVVVSHGASGQTKTVHRSELPQLQRWGWTETWDPRKAQPVAPAPAPVSQTPGPSPDPASALADEPKPIDGLVRMSGKPPEESKRVLEGIGQLLHGDAGGAWSEAYLNDVARLAWAKQERSQGRNVDPRDAPQGYIESWKDAFLGSDHSVPLVKELDQQMIDHAVEKSGGPDRPFRWQEAFGPTGEGGLISRQVASNDCGPNGFSTVMRSLGYNADPAQTFEYAKKYGYHNGEQFTGPNNMARMLRQEAGIDASAHPIDWSVVDRELDEGRVVLLSSGGHYWAVSARRQGPNGTEYYAGATASVVGNPEWTAAGGLRYGGAPDYMIVARGTADPNSRFVQEMGLKPPTGTGPDRAMLSMTTRQRAEERIRREASRGPQGSVVLMEEDEALRPYMTTLTRAAYEEKVDPALVGAMLAEESGGNPDAESRVGAQGLMQLMPATARSVGVSDIRDPYENIKGGSRYLRQMLERYDGNVELALAAYNAGPGAVDQYGGVPPYGETRAYIERVLARYQRYRGGK